MIKAKEDSEKVGLKLNIQKTKMMASGPITSWEIDGETMKQCQILFFWAPKSLQMLTAAIKLKDTCSLDESYNQPRQHIKKQRPTKVCLVKAMVFPVVIYECKSLTYHKEG